MGARSSLTLRRAGCRAGRPRPISPSSIGQWPAHTRQVACGRAHLLPSPLALGPRAPGGTRTRTRAPASSDYSVITGHVIMPVQVTALAPRMRTFKTARREPASGPGPCPLIPAPGVIGLLKPCTWLLESAFAHRSSRPSCCFSALSSL
jgi:hypothetical protein